MATHDNPGYCENHLFYVISNFAGPTWIGKANVARKIYEIKDR